VDVVNLFVYFECCIAWLIMLPKDTHMCASL